MALNKHNIIPLIESYYHTFTPLERTIADFFIHNTDEQDFSSKMFPDFSMFQKHPFPVSHRSADFMGTENSFTNTSKA